METKFPHEEFAERVRLQVAARYGDSEVRVEPATFSISVGITGREVTLPLAALLQQAERNPANVSTLIAKFVRDIETKGGSDPGPKFALSQPLWCVRTREYLKSVVRADELLVREIAGDLVAFVAQLAPNNAMRGIPRNEWRSEEVDDESIAAAADANTEKRFQRLIERVEAIDRVPADGWRLSVDELFCASALLVPSIRENLVAKAGDEVLIATPDRSLMLAIPIHAAGARQFGFRVTREWREAMHPCSKTVFITDGGPIREAAPRPEMAGGLMSWFRR